MTQLEEVTAGTADLEVSEDYRGRLACASRFLVKLVESNTRDGVYFDRLTNKEVLNWMQRELGFLASVVGKI